MSANCTVAAAQGVGLISATTSDLAFQIIDDILDITQTSERLGKTAARTLSAKGDLSDIVGWKNREERPAAPPIGAFAGVENFHGKAVGARSAGRCYPFAAGR